MHNRNDRDWNNINYRVLYLVFDPIEKIYKDHNNISGVDNYHCGELFFTSEKNIPYETYYARAYLQDRIIYEAITLHQSHGIDNFDYQLNFQEPLLKQYGPIFLRAYKIHQNIGPFKNLWILFELAPAPKILDQLEVDFNYNIIGDSQYSFDYSLDKR